MSVVLMPVVGTVGADAGSPSARPSGDGKPPKSDREKFSVTLSGRTADLFSELKELTDADTDSEVFRNALRLHYMLVKAHQKGFVLYMKDATSGTLNPVMLGSELAA